MSTKTLRKRIALATVAALGAGVLSLTSTTVANAAQSSGKDYTNAVIGASTGVNANTSSVGTLLIGTVQSTDGTGTAGTVTSPAASTAKSFGLLSIGDIAGNTGSSTIAGTTQTATLLSTGKLSVYETHSANNNYDAIVVTGGTITGSSGANTSVSASLTTAASYAATAASWGVVITPHTGATSMTVALYTNGGVGAMTTPTGGTLSGFINVTIASTSAAGTMSTAKSGVFYNAQNATSTLVTTDNTTAGVGSSAYDTAQYATVVIRDAYSSPVTSGLVQVTATNGAYVSMKCSTSTSTQTPTTPTSSTVPYDSLAGGYCVVGAKAPSNTPLSTTVTVTANGAVVGTKGFSFTGKVAKVTLSDQTNGKATSTGTMTLAFADSAGNAIYPSASNTANGNGLVLNVGSTAGYSLSTFTNPTSSTAGSLTYGCTSSNSKGKVSVDYTNVDGTVVTSNVIPVSCSNNPLTYTAAFDKTNYVAGDIATLTVTFKDSYGDLAADIAAGTNGVTRGAGTTTTPTITGSQLTAVSAPTNADTTTNGLVKYKFVIGTTAGKYSAIVDFPNLDSSSTPQEAVTVSYSVVDNSTSLNDVLKGIVALIASINKQIAALAKLVTKKK